MVGAVGTGAPWFLTGWAEVTEVEFMIDLKILAALKMVVLMTRITMEA